MMSSLIPLQSTKRTCFEDLPDEILLLICRYLSPINILDSLLNLNNRLHKTITSYRENIFLSHLSQKNFYHLINTYLPYLAFNIRCLYINNCSMLNTGKIFEEKFNKIDQQFPLLRELTFNQIDIETLENLSWRFNTMTCLRQLNIDITEDRLSSMPVQFDEFLCGKLFSVSNSFENLILNLNNYHFSLHSLTHQCLNLRYLTISVKRLNDLLILFNYLPNIEHLNIVISCSSPYDSTKDTYQYDQLWWKVHYLTKFQLTIQEKELTSHDNVIPYRIISKIVENLYSLVYIQFNFNIKFNSALQLTTTKDFYVEKYFPYANGLLWEQTLERNDNRTMHFELHIELDGIATTRPRGMMETDRYFVDKNNDIDFNSLIKTTFSTAYWLQKNISVQCSTTTSKHVSIYTVPITHPHLSTTINVIDKEISMKSSLSHINVQRLVIHSDVDNSSLKLSITKLFTKFPYLTDLKIDPILILPPTISICSYRLRSLSLQNYSLASCCELLDYLPQVTSLSMISTSSKISIINSCPKPILSITRLKISINLSDTHNLSTKIQYFPNVTEFYLMMNNTSNRSVDDFHRFEKFECFSQGFRQLRYLQIAVPTKQDSNFFLTWMHQLSSNKVTCIKTTNENSLILKAWF